MFTSIDQLDKIFYRYDDGTIASIVECNRWLLTELVLAAVSNDYWLSKHALKIISIGVDTIQTGDDSDDILYLELLTVADWGRLVCGPHSRSFPLEHLDHINGWPLGLLTLSIEDLDGILKYLSTWIDSKDAIMALGHRYSAEIMLLVPRFDIIIWQYLVQLPDGQGLVSQSLDKYSSREQKKIQEYLYEYGAPIRSRFQLKII